MKKAQNKTSEILSDFVILKNYQNILRQWENATSASMNYSQKMNLGKFYRSLSKAKT